MTSAVDVANLGLGKMRADLINSFDDPSAEAKYAKLFYNNIRRRLLRTAPWGFARKTITLTPTGSALNTPPDNTYPFIAQYTYPADCVKLRYILQPPPPPSNVVPATPGEPLFWQPWMMPSRSWRFLESYVNSQKMILANVLNALAVYNADVQSPDIWDDLFIDALASALAYELTIPLSGEIGMKADFKALTEDAITRARVADGNEAEPSVDHTPDWIRARGLGNGNFGGLSIPGAGLWGNWCCSWDNMAWGS